MTTSTDAIVAQGINLGECAVPWEEDGKYEGVRMRVPLELLRAGIKMRALVPEAKRDKINEKLKEKGIEGDVFDMSEDQIDDLIRSLCELEIEAGEGDGGVRIFLE